jgi:hypothetical protein
MRIADWLRRDKDAKPVEPEASTDEPEDGEEDEDDEEGEVYPLW